MKPRAACIITSYNRPKLVQDAIVSVLNQTMPTQCIVMDDGSNAETRFAIEALFGYGNWPQYGQVVFLPESTPSERLGACRYSRSINLALNHHLAPSVEFVCFLPDDDYLYPESVEARVNFLDDNPKAHVAFGRLRAVHYGADGTYNQWGAPGPAKPGMYFPRPTIRMVDGNKARTFFEPDHIDPETCLSFVNEGFWQWGEVKYGGACCPDHSQVLLRRSCLNYWAYPDYWPEDIGDKCGDCEFYSRLGERFSFWGVDAWCCTKRYHARGSGVFVGEERE